MQRYSHHPRVAKNERMNDWLTDFLLLPARIISWIGLVLITGTILDWKIGKPDWENDLMPGNEIPVQLRVDSVSFVEPFGGYYSASGDRYTYIHTGQIPAAGLEKMPAWYQKKDFLGLIAFLLDDKGLRAINPEDHGWSRPIFDRTLTGLHPWRLLYIPWCTSWADYERLPIDCPTALTAFSLWFSGPIYGSVSTTYRLWRRFWWYTASWFSWR